MAIAAGNSPLNGTSQTNTTYSILCSALLCSLIMLATARSPPPHLRCTFLPKLMLCSPAHNTAVRSLRDHGKLCEAASSSPEDQDDAPTRRLRQRQEFEHLVRDARSEDAAAVWASYARWEESRGDLPRARAVWERAVARIPWAEQLWSGYAQMEEELGSYACARQVFERWMEWRPGMQGWLAYAEFELRNGEVRRARAVYERLVRGRPGDAAAWARFAEFEARHGGVERTRACYERAVEAVVEGEGGEGAEELVYAFAEFEERCRKTERARGIYLHALEHLPERRAEALRREYQAFERRCR